jgi:hypothetical protein
VEKLRTVENYHETRGMIGQQAVALEDIMEGDLIRYDPIRTGWAVVREGEKDGK